MVKNRFSALFKVALLLALFPVTACATTLTGASTFKAVLTWSFDSTCTATSPCLVQVYRLTGSCPATLIGSTGWTLITTTAQQATTAEDNTISDGVSYSYVLYSVWTNGVSSDPSACWTASVNASTVPDAPQSVGVQIVPK